MEKSNYSSILFLIDLDYNRFFFLNYRYNDIPLIIDQEAYDKLREAGIDHLLAQHVAHLFIRDPVSLFSEKVNQNDEEDSDHFEVLNQTFINSIKDLTLLLFNYRICNRPTGRLCASSRHRRKVPLVGELNFVLVRLKLPILRTLPVYALSFC